MGNSGESIDHSLSLEISLKHMRKVGPIIGCVFVIDGRSLKRLIIIKHYPVPAQDLAIFSSPHVNTNQLGSSIGLPDNICTGLVPLTHHVV